VVRLRIDGLQPGHSDQKFENEPGVIDISRPEIYWTGRLSVLRLSPHVFEGGTEVGSLVLLFPRAAFCQEALTSSSSDCCAFAPCS